MDMIQKQNWQLASGNIQIHQNPSWHVKFNPMLRQCWFFGVFYFFDMNRIVHKEFVPPEGE